MKKLLRLLALVGFVFCLSCESANKEITVTNADTTEEGQKDRKNTSEQEKITASTKTAGDTDENTVLAWVDNLNIRSQPNTKSKVVLRVKENTALTLVGETTDFTETITLRGQSFTEPWVKVKTTDGQTGWVFQGAVKKPGEDKRIAFSTSGKIEEFSFGECEKLTSLDLSCSCSFSTGDPYQGPTVYASNWDETACVNVNGELMAFYNDDLDFKQKLKELAKSEYWIILNQRGPMLYFGQPLESYGYDNEIELLTDVILASGKNYSEISIKNNSQGMAIREVRDVANDAIAKAKDLKSRGFENSMYYARYGNKNYNLILRTRRMTNYEGEANKYEGILTLLSNDGKTVLDKKAISGTCGC